ncbi:MAG: hypothetical protein KC561_16580, partial [Myxococcales bacterium]|nr:hypothetical protein [Myxococcales bacterium]
GPRLAEYRVFCACWALAGVARLTLMQAEQPSWFVPNLLVLLSGVGLVIYGGRLFWLVSAAGLLGPVLFLGDWLTQSLLMGVTACVGIVVTSRHSTGRALLAASAGLTCATYVAAAFHKLNSGFLSPEASCANELLPRLAAHFGSGSIAQGLHDLGAWPGWPLTAISAELLVVVLVFLRPRVGLIFALLFHLPLTVAYAPVFVFATLPGLMAAVLLSGPLPTIHKSTARSVVVLASCGALSTVVLVTALALGYRDEWTMYPKVWLLMALTAAAIGVPGGWGKPMWQVGRRPGGIALLAFLVALSWASTPYWANNLQHAGAMLSNLRIDRPCWNHLLVPRPASDDGYVRIEHASLGDPSLPPGELREELTRRERVLLDQLWSPGAMLRVRENWCVNSARPIRISGTYRGRPFESQDWCAEDAGVLAPSGVFGGDAWFPNYLRYQKNLTRSCEQVCLH